MFVISVNNELEIDLQLKQKYLDYFVSIKSLLFLKFFIIKRKIYPEPTVFLSSIINSD